MFFHALFLLQSCDFRYLVSRLSYRQRVAEMDLQTGSTSSTNPTKHGAHYGKQHSHPPSKQQPHSKHSATSGASKQGVQQAKQLGSHQILKQSKQAATVATGKQTSKQAAKQSGTITETAEKKAKKKINAKPGKQGEANS